MSFCEHSATKLAKIVNFSSIIFNNAIEIVFLKIDSFITWDIIGEALKKGMK